ncbi:MAG TPA: glycosyltransferase [Ktedonobacterales bacterium]|jgi:UDP:flavonoid glycosyltransferase YjiC (YdhE family)
MRMLFTTLQLSGHFHPLVPIARAAVAAGHEVAVACAASFAPTVERAGLRAFPAGFDLRGRPEPACFPGILTVPGDTMWSWAPPRLHVDVYAVAMVPDLLTIARAWHPDLIVRDANEYGGCVAAEVLGIPHATVRTGSTTSRYGLRDIFAEPLARLRELNGLPPDPNVDMPFRYLHLAAEPPRFRGAGEPVAPTAHPLRPVNFEAGDEESPPWVAELPDRPTIYATLGTLANRGPVARALFAALLAALRDEPFNLILTVGRENDPADFGAQPENVRIARFIPQSALLPHCDLVVHQGGFSTVTGVLNAGLPMVIIPIFADQPYNAECCAALGVGRVLSADERTPQAIREAVRAILAEPAYRQNAAGVRNEMAALPGPAHGVALLERLAAGQQPLLTA